MNYWRKFWIMLILLLTVWVGVCTEAFSAPKKAPKPEPKDTITYVVKKGDSVDKIAKKYNVKSDDIARWNNLSDVAHIRIGQTLRIRVPRGSAAAVAGSAGAGKGAAVVSQPVSYVVKKGDNLGKISRKTGVSIEDLKKNNPYLKKNPDKLKAGQTLVLRIQRFEGGTGVSRGLANNGSLSGGIMLKNGPGYFVRNPKHSYGTAMSVGLIMDAMAAYAKKFPKGPKFSVGDLSAEKGGKLAPHVSHQSGRDVDITFIQNASGFDVEKNWFLIEYFLKTKKVQYIFVDYNLQKTLYDYARKHGYSESALVSLIQYPGGKKSYSAIVRHSKGHVNHLHVRFICAPTDKDCH